MCLCNLISSLQLGRVVALALLALYLCSTFKNVPLVDSILHDLLITMINHIYQAADLILVVIESTQRVLAPAVGVKSFNGRRCHFKNLILKY